MRQENGIRVRAQREDRWILDQRVAGEKRGFELRRNFQRRETLLCLWACLRRSLRRRNANQRCDAKKHQDPPKRSGTIPEKPEHGSTYVPTAASSALM